MYELKQVSDSCYYIQSPAKIGLVKLNDTDVCLIDSGNDKDAGRKVRQILDANRWHLTAIYNTLALGAKELVLAENFTDGDVVHEIAEQANRFGKKCLDAGLTLSYHNAYDDMKRVGDESLLDIFLDETCPELVHLELNSFWSFCNGMTPLEYLKKYGARARLLHVTDLKAPINYELLSEPMTDDAFAPLVMHTRMTLANFTELGQGALEIRELAAEAVKLGIEAIIIEQYSTEISPLESSRISIANLNKAVAAL